MLKNTMSRIINIKLLRKRNLIMPMQIPFLLVCVFLEMQITSANVYWKLKEHRIVLGKPLTLECTTLTIRNEYLSRRWTGGLENRLLCFNGVTSNPSKYKATEEFSNKYTLQIKKTTEDDLECPYSCRFGFYSHEKWLYVTEDNFQYLPNENTTKIEYGMNNYNYTLQLEFKNIFPRPVCGIQIKDTLKNITTVKESKGRIFYHLSYRMESSESLHACGSQLEIKCTFGNTLYSVYRSHDLSCTALDTHKLATVYIVCIAIATPLAALVVIMIILYKTKKIDGYFNCSGKPNLRRTDCGNHETPVETSELSEPIDS